MFNSTTYNSQGFNGVRKRTAQFISRAISRVITLGQAEHAVAINQNGKQSSDGLNVSQKSNSIMLQ